MRLESGGILQARRRDLRAKFRAGPVSGIHQHNPRLGRKAGMDRNPGLGAPQRIVGPISGEMKPICHRKERDRKSVV